MSESGRERSSLRASAGNHTSRSEAGEHSSGLKQFCQSNGFWPGKKHLRRFRDGGDRAGNGNGRVYATRTSTRDVVDRRSDVYSIGAILYCLLTGRPPFQAATQMETLLQVLEREPIPPKQLNPVIGTDLQTIALKCLQKIPSRRYDTAEEVADELQRVLEDRPIIARPVSSLERCWRWCQRNRTVAVLLTGLAASIVIGIIAVSVQWRRAEAAYGLATIRVVKLTEAEVKLANQLYASSLLRGDALSLAGQNLQAESLFWQLADDPIDPDDRRAWWRLWKHYWQEPRKLGAKADDCSLVTP